MTIDLNGDLWAGTNMPITVCGDGSYCCGIDSSSYPGANADGVGCCQAGQGMRVEDGKLISMDPSKAAPTSSRTSIPLESTLSTTTPKISISQSGSTSSPSTSSSSTIPQPDNLANSTDIGAKIGGVFGGIAGLIIILLATWGVLKAGPRKNVSTLLPNPATEDDRQRLETGSWRPPVEVPAALVAKEKTELDGEWIRELDSIHLSGR